MGLQEHSAAPSGHRSTPRSGVTRPEIVFFLAVLLLAVSLIAPGFVAAKRQRELARARADIALIMDAAGRYFREYGVWPVPGDARQGDVRYGRDRANRELMNALRSVKGPGNEGGSANPQSIVYLRLEPAVAGLSGLSADGDFIDPWGMPYQAVVDADFDGSCDVLQSIYGRLLGEGMVVWSCGPDRASDTADDILSWKAR